MNGSTEPEAASASASTTATATAEDGQQNLNTEGVSGEEVKGSPPTSTIEKDGRSEGNAQGEGDEDANSEAETVLTSPVKKRQLQGVHVKVEEAAAEKAKLDDVGEEDDDEEADAPGSPDDTLMVDAAPANPEETNHEEHSDKEDESALSDISPTRSSLSAQSSRASSRSRAASEMPEIARNGHRFPNPKKRKHRASSVSLPNKRQSMDVAKRRLRGMYSEDGAGKHPGDRSPSPKGRNHRRAVSTQSAFLDGASEVPSGRKRRNMPQFPVRDAKPTRAAWDESSISSEATSHGQSDQKRPQRGVGRSTSTPGRPLGGTRKPHTNKYGFTKLAEACEAGDLDLVREWREREPDQLELAEYAGNTPLQIAALNGNVEVVEYLIDQGCHVDCANVDRDTPLLDAAENGHLDVVEVLLKAGVDPLRQNRKGQQALDVVSDETENAAEIKSTLLGAIAEWNSNDAKQRREEEEEQRYRAGPQKELHFMARTYENLLKLVTNNDRGAVREFLDAHVPVDNVIIAAAARTGDSYLVNMLLAEMTDKKASQKPEKPMNSVLGSSHFEMVRQLTELDHFNPLYRDRNKRSWPEIAEQKRGPMWKQEVELLQRLYDEASREKMARRSSSPVTKRDHALRRPATLKSGENSDEDEEEDEDEDEEEAPKRKGGRRLMSRRDMLAAKHGTDVSSAEDEEMEESDDTCSIKEAAAREAKKEESMKPPDSPNTKRGVGRPPRRKSFSNAAAAMLMTEVPVDRTGVRRRRSSSLREPVAVLASVDEKMEDVGADADADADADGEIEEPAAGIPDTPAVDEEQKRLEEDSARARQAEEEAQRAEATTKAEEERRVQAARDAEEAQRAEEARKAQEARDAELARKAEEARQLREVQKRKRREDLVAALPPGLAHLLASPEAGNADIVLQNFTPLQAVSLPTAGGASGAELYVLNVQVAPLLGEAGLDFLLSSSSSYSSSSPSPTDDGEAEAQWTTLPFADSDKPSLPLILPAHLLIPSALDPTSDFESMDLDLDSLTFAQELARTASRVQAAREAHLKLVAAAAPLQLRWVRLADVRGRVRPEFEGCVEEVVVRRDFRRGEDCRIVRKRLDGEGKGGFVERVGSFWGKGCWGVCEGVWVGEGK